MPRILTTYLLLVAGYVYVPYSSMEAIIENSKEACYLVLRQTQGTINNDNPHWQPWVLFFLKTLQQQKRRLEVKLTQEQLLLRQLPPLSMHILQLAKSRGSITIGEIVLLTEANRNTVKKHSQILIYKRLLKKTGTGKSTWYNLRSNPGGVSHTPTAAHIVILMAVCKNRQLANAIRAYRIRASTILSVSSPKTNFRKLNPPAS